MRSYHLNFFNGGLIYLSCVIVYTVKYNNIKSWPKNDSTHFTWNWENPWNGEDFNSMVRGPLVPTINWLPALSLIRFLGFVCVAIVKVTLPKKKRIKKKRYCLKIEIPYNWESVTSLPFEQAIVRSTQWSPLAWVGAQDLSRHVAPHWWLLTIARYSKSIHRGFHMWVAIQIKIERGFNLRPSGYSGIRPTSNPGRKIVGDPDPWNIAH